MFAGAGYIKGVGKGCREEHLLARPFFSVLSCRARLSTFNLRTHMRVAQDVHSSCVAPLRTQKIISSHSMFHRTLLGVPTDNHHFTTADWNLLCHFARTKAVWPSG